MLVMTQANAITPTPEMLEQFKRMPKAEQQRLMKQYGLSPAMLKNGQVQNKGLQTPNVAMPVENIYSSQTAVSMPTEPKTAFAERTLKPFGYDIFSNAPTTFAPVNDIAIPSEYQMGPSDQVSIQLFGKENNQYELTVSRSGLLNVPDIGPVAVIGLSFLEMKRKLKEQISQRYIGVDINIGLGELRSIQIFVAGDANKPGSYTISSLSTITQVLFAAGGINENGSLRNILLKRNGKLVSTFDLYDLLMKGDASKDKRLQSGDVLFIPPVGETVSVKGQVRRPAIYELKGGESMAQLIRLAGQLKPGAYSADSVVERFDELQLSSLINVDLTTKQGRNLKAKNGDVLTVQGTSTRKHKQVALMGAVNRPGLYQWRAGMRVSDLIKSTWRDLKNSADLHYALITREINLQGDISVIQIDLQHVLNDQSSASNIALTARDTLIVFNNAPLSLERGELNKLIAEKIQPYVKKNFAERTGPNTDKLFSLGFETLALSVQVNEIKTIVAAELVDEQEVALATKYVDEVLYKHYNEKTLLKISSLLTRQELLYPVIEKLKSQQRKNGAFNVGTLLVSIAGEVRFPGVYPLTKLQNVNQLIAAAGGLTVGAYIKKAELTRSAINNQLEMAVEHMAITLDSHQRTMLQSQDHLQILTVPDWQKNMQVEIAGEVKFPGVYSIKNGETMMSVLQRAGGFTDLSFAKGAIFTRESVQQQEKQQILALTDQLRRDIATRGLSQEGNFVSFDDSSKMLAELENLQAIGRMVINIAQLQTYHQEQNSKRALRLEDGDKLYIPSQKQIVTVVGEVQHASSHFFQETIDVEDYLTLAGGIKQRANESGIYIIRADGSVMLPQQGGWFSELTKIEPGDTIVVPLNTEYKDTLTLWSQITGILYNTSIAIAAIKGL
ncbi:MAG: SLBB domain-containing protein [Psychrobium sp.]|nr:SLBB domain-containing protein [Psychrobium sp.]